ncbi:MAG TPA: hypothetical protein VFL31_06795 [Nitrospiraceae bacterium]|nr:hypothetical protein [Nitrospiraceae bacterium]
MKQICLVALTLSLLILPHPLLGQTENSGGSPMDGLRSKDAETMITTGVPCKAGTVIVAQADPEERGECRCPPMLGAKVSGCSGYSRLECQLKTCHYETFDVEEGRVTDKGDIDCSWHPGGIQ